MAQEYKGQIRGFPEEIVERMLECQVEQGNSKDVSVFEDYKHAGGLAKGFTWSKSKEGDDFWSSIINQKEFEKFYELYPKSTISEFEVGKWYKSNSWTAVSFCKASERKSFISDRIYFSEIIRRGKHEIKQDWWNNRNVVPASSEEIQSYLPEGHPDKTKTISEFKKGDYIVCLNTPEKGSSFPKNHVFKQKTDYYYLMAELDCLGSTTNGWVAVDFLKQKTFSDWRYATTEEIAEYNRLGKPFDVTTLSKKEVFNNTSLKNQVKAGLQLKGRWLKCIKCTTWHIEIKPGEYIQINENDSTLPFTIFKGYTIAFDLGRVDKNEFELMPEGWTPNVKTSSKADSLLEKIPEYVECTESGTDCFTVGKIYASWPEPRDNDGVRRCIGVFNGNIWSFKPSTKEAYEAQNSKIVDRTKYYKVNSSKQYKAVLDYFKSKGEKVRDIFSFAPPWEIVYFDGDKWRLGCKRHLNIQTPEDIKMLEIVESNFESVLNSHIPEEKDLFQVGNYAVCINDNANHSKGRVTEINHVINRDEFVGDNLRSNYKCDFKAFESIREANAFSNSLSKGTGSIIINEISIDDCSFIGPPPKISFSVPKIKFTKETIKTHVIPTNVIDIQLKTKKKKQLFTI